MIRFPNIVIIALSMLILQTVLIDLTTVKGDPDTTLLGCTCGSDTWEMGDPYGDLVERMLNDLPVECAQDPNHMKNVEHSSGDIVAYGSAWCDKDLSEDDCKACLAVAQETLLTNCPFCMSASATLADCFMSYSNNAS